MASARLTDILPQDGLVIPRTQLMSSLSVEQKARNAFRSSGVIAGPGKKHVDSNRRNVDDAVARLLERGCQEDILAFYRGRPDGNGNGGFLAFLNALRAAGTWSSAMPWHVFAEFVYRIVRAKVEWTRSPRLPLDAAEHSATARKVEVLLEKAPEFWVQCQVYIGSPYMIALHARENLAEIERAATSRAANWGVYNGAEDGIESAELEVSSDECLEQEISRVVDAMKIE